MRQTHPRRHAGIRRLGVAVTAGALLVAGAPASFAAPAAGPEAHASAQSVNLALASGALTLQVSANGGTTADNDGTDSIYPVRSTPALALLGGQDFLAAGALSEVAEADIDGSSYACAGIASPGGTVEVGDQGKNCTLTGNGTGGVTIDLAQIPGVGSLLSTVASVTLTADALTANAYDEGTPGSQQGTGTIAGLMVHVTLLSGLLGTIDLPVDVPSGVNQPLLPAIVQALTDYTGDPLGLLNPLITLLSTTLAGVVALTSNYQNTASGVLTVSALHVSLLGNTLATADLAKATVGPNAALTDCNPFTDVDNSNPFCHDILWLKIGGITKGYGDGTVYKPSWQTSREWMAAFLYRFANPDASDPTCASQPFTDVLVSNQFCGDIAWLKDQGITAGFTDGSFHPHSNIARQGVAAFLYRLTQGEDAPDCTGTEGPFPDVPADYQFCGAISWFQVQGISQGYVGGEFQPVTPVTRQVMAAWIHRYSTMYARPGTV